MGAATITGIIFGEIKLSHELYGEKFYKFFISSERNSGAVDIVPVIISERTVDVSTLKEGVFVDARGEINTHNSDNSSKKSLDIYLNCREITVNENYYGMNDVTFEGFICKAPSYRSTPNGREITDLCIAVPRPYGKSSYIPCIVWGKNARYAGGLEIGTKLYISGRFQSRTYTKKYTNGTSEEKTAYEVSVNIISKAVEGTEDAE